MALDVYQKALFKLYEVTEGRGSKAVDFKSLVKQLGFIAHYSEIFERLSVEGWIVESPKADFVCISHWGVAEAKKSAAPAVATATPNAAGSELKSEADRATTASKELSRLLEIFAQNTSANNFQTVEKKLEELQAAVARIKKNLA